VLEEKRGLREVNTWRLKHKAVRLDNKSRTIVRQAILKEAERLGQVIYSLAVCSSHVHLVVGVIDEPAGKIAGRYKRAATKALRESGFTDKVWTRGYDKRYCFDEKSLCARMAYVEKHNLMKEPRQK
jgi:REP element-mobilizing transposase RayT